MKKIQIRFNKKTAILLVVLLAIALIAALGLYIFLKLKPETTEQSVVSNSFNTVLEYKMTGDMKKSTLYPEGGTFEVDKVLMKEITKEAKITVTYKLKSDKVVDLNATVSLMMDVIAVDRWKKERIIIESKTISTSTAEELIIDETFNIELKTIDKFIERVEEETRTASSEYLLVITPIINGSVTYNDKVKILDSGLAVEMIYQSRMIEMPEVISYKDSASYMETIVTPNAVNYLGTTDLEVSRQRALIILSVISLMLLSVIGFSVKKNLFIKSIEEKVLRKFKSELMMIESPLDQSCYQVIIVDDYQNFYKIATRRDIEILCYKAKNSNAYYIIEENQLYLLNIIR